MEGPIKLWVSRVAAESRGVKITRCSLEVRAGEVAVVAGPGSSLLADVCLGRQPRTRGDVLLDNRLLDPRGGHWGPTDVHVVDCMPQDIGSGTRHPTPLPPLQASTALETLVALTHWMAGFGTDAAHEAVAAQCRRFGVDDLASRDLAPMSSGHAALWQVLRSSLVTPSLLIVDLPRMRGDAAERRMLGVLGRLAHEDRVAVLLRTDEMERLPGIAQRLGTEVRRSVHVFRRRRQHCSLVDRTETLVIE